MKFLEFRKRKLNYLNRFLIYFALYLISDLIGGSYKTGSLGLPIGGIILAPITFFVSYGFAFVIGIWFKFRFIGMGIKNWFYDLHYFTINLALWFYDFSLLYLLYTLFNGGLKPI